MAESIKDSCGMLSFFTSFITTVRFFSKTKFSLLNNYENSFFKKSCMSVIMGNKQSIPCKSYMNSAIKTAPLFHVRNIEARNPLGHPVRM